MSKSVHYRIIFGGDPIFMATTTLSQLAVLGTNSMLTCLFRSRISGATENIPSHRHQAEKAPTAQSKLFPCCSLTRKRKRTRPCCDCLFPIHDPMGGRRRSSDHIGASRAVCP